MRKVLMVVLIVILISLTGCSRPVSNIEDGIHWLETVDRNDDYYVVRHRQTGVCYLVSRTGLVMLVNTDGSPYTMGSNNDN